MELIIRSSSSRKHQKELAMLKQIKVEQTFANQVYANFQSLKFGIESCSYTYFVLAVLRKALRDWQHAASDKVVVATETKGVFVEPLARINASSSMSCPETPSNVCTILDLENLLNQQ